jgi:hypothetical protein
MAMTLPSSYRASPAGYLWPEQPIMRDSTHRGNLPLMRAYRRRCALVPVLDRHAEWLVLSGWRGSFELADHWGEQVVEFPDHGRDRAPRRGWRVVRRPGWSGRQAVERDGSLD